MLGVRPQPETIHEDGLDCDREFDVKVNKTPGSRLGITFDQSDGVSILVKKVNIAGLLDAWNKVNMHDYVQTGDRIVEINGVRGAACRQVDQCKQDHALHMRVRRPTHVKLAFKPRSLGLVYHRASGRIYEVKRCGQAEDAGVRVGWRLDAIDGQGYCAELYASKKAGGLDYEVTFATGDDRVYTWTAEGVAWMKRNWPRRYYDLGSPAPGGAFRPHRLNPAEVSTFYSWLQRGFLEGAAPAEHEDVEEEATEGSTSASQDDAGEASEERESDSDTSGGATHDPAAPEVDPGGPDAPVVACLREGVVRVVRGEWLVERPPDYVVERRQDLPEEAFLAPGAAAGMMLGEAAAGRIVCMSYGWLTREHPDPHGFHLATVRQYLSKSGRYNGYFWDFMSLPQAGPGAGEADAALRSRGLRVMHRLYGSEKTATLQLTLMPPEPGMAPYWDRGWCFFEATVSSIRKMDLWDAGSQPAREELAAAGRSQFVTLLRVMTGQRLPPLAPDEMRQELAKRSFTNGKKDSTLVADLYAEFFAEAAASTTSLLFSKMDDVGNGWGDRELQQLARAVPFFRALEWIALRGHGFGDDGFLALAAQLSTLPSFSALYIQGREYYYGGDNTTFGAHCLHRLDDLLPGLKELELPARLSHTPEAQRLREAWASQGNPPDALKWK